MKKRNTFRLVAFLIILVIGAVGFFVLVPSAIPGNHFWNNLTKRIEKGQREITFSSLTETEWDLVCVLEPHSLKDPNKEENIGRLIKGELGKFRDKLPNFNDDWRWAFAFVRDGAVVALEERGRGYDLYRGREYYLYRGYEQNCIPKDLAIFKVDGQRIVVTLTSGDFYLSTMISEVNKSREGNRATEIDVTEVVEGFLKGRNADTTFEEMREFGFYLRQSTDKEIKAGLSRDDYFSNYKMESAPFAWSRELSLIIHVEDGVINSVKSTVFFHAL